MSIRDCCAPPPQVFVIGPDKKTKLILVYPTSVGRNFAEILRFIDALQLAARFPIATPVNWVRARGRAAARSTGRLRARGQWGTTP